MNVALLGLKVIIVDLNGILWGKYGVDVDNYQNCGYDQRVHICVSALKKSIYITCSFKVVPKKGIEPSRP